MAHHLRPIPTWYNGVLHRSGLEARYAALFYELGIQCDWEPQGFDADGTWYRPDFMLLAPLGIVWAEIKGSWEQDPAGIQRWRTFSLWRPTPSRSALFIGMPAVGNCPLIIGGDPDDENPAAGHWEDDTQDWRPCPAGYHFDLTWPGQFGGNRTEDGCPYSDQEGAGQDKLERAIQIARNCRFDNRPPASGSAA